MEKEELAEAIGGLRVVRAGLRLSIPSEVRTVGRIDVKPPRKRGHDPPGPGIREFLRPWAEVVRPDGAVTKIDPNVRSDTIRRNLLTAAGGGGLGRFLRSDPCRSAMADLQSDLREKVAEAWRKDDYRLLRRRAERILRKRERKDRGDAVTESIAGVRRELMGPASAMSEEELVTLYRECQVRRVLES